MKITEISGFTLIELMITIVVIGILAMIAYPSYLQYVRMTRLFEAKSALLINSQALERFYLRNTTFKANSTTWASLPIEKTDYFCLRLQGNPRGAADERFTLKAVAYDKQQEPRVLKINQDFTMLLCEESASACNETKPFFSGGSAVDKHCRIQ
ncbi:type IV pilin protein [Stenoxybacter acetivorans]|uniref:type IV pilin protein n=1 Tax=Stenoxybacter acetivorans TaxID=422441 RepID=UPI00055EFCB6|nr:type IV pilin protein [Stenoxybacter acetivorans]